MAQIGRSTLRLCVVREQSFALRLKSLWDLEWENVIIRIFLIEGVNLFNRKSIIVNAVLFVLL